MAASRPDCLFSARHGHVPTLREGVVWSAIHLGIAIEFGIGVWAFGNLFVFVFIMSSFVVPRIARQKA